MAKREKKQPEESGGESAPIWIISFADLVVVLMGFFVVMLTMSGMGASEDTDVPDFADIVAAIRESFGYIPPANSSDEIDLRILLRNLKPQQRGRSGTSGNPGEASRRTEGLAGKHDMVTTVRTGSQTTIGGYVSFGKTSAEISSESAEVIGQIADKIRGHMNVFLVKGHTSRDEEFELRDTDRDLAYERAVAVMQKLVEFGVARQGLRVQSCRDFEPIREGAYSEVHRTENRRVEVIATEALVSEYRGHRSTGESANTLADYDRRGEASE